MKRVSVEDTAQAKGTHSNLSVRVRLAAKTSFADYTYGKSDGQTMANDTK